jgi:hypothetical protein
MDKWVKNKRGGGETDGKQKRPCNELVPIVTALGSGGGGHKYISLQKYTDVEIVIGSSDEVGPSSPVTVPPKVCIDSISQTITINITNHLKHNL